MKKLFPFLILLFSASAFGQTVTSKQYNEDFDYFWNTIDTYYSYWDKKQTDWIKVKETYSPFIDTVSSKRSFVLVLEKIFHELYDHHASLSTNTMESQRLVPSGADIWAEFVNGKAIVTEVRKNFGAYNGGLRAGMEIVAFNDVDIHKAIKPFVAKSLKVPDREAQNYALRVLLAGQHIGERKITVKHFGNVLQFVPDKPVSMLSTHRFENSIESKILTGNIGYIRINNRLWDNSIIRQFDSVMYNLRNTKSLILDLRETPSGGNTTVARAIIGKFITKPGFYQKHELTGEEKERGVKRSWVEIVSPVKNPYTKPLVILANHWTGSVGEGIIVGFDALKRGTIIGTPMAALNGAIYSFTMPNTGIGFSFPAEKLFHVNGTPREKFEPHITVDQGGQFKEDDLILERALRVLRGGR